jgi:hypothetical protein
VSNWQIWYLSIVKIFKDVAIFGTIFWTPKLIKEILTGGPEAGGWRLEAARPQPCWTS